MKLIEEGTITDKDLKYLSKYYAVPYHAITMKRLGELEGKDSSSYISPCVSIAKRVQKKLNLEKFDWSNGQFRFFPVCFLGRYNEDGLFEWQLRPELAAAMNEDCPAHLGIQFNHMYQLEEKEAAKIPVDDLIQEAQEYHGGPAPVYTIPTVQRKRNAKLVRAIKAIAKGVCQLCGNTLDFKDQDGWPYLEAHHIVPLADEGIDDLTNMAALCPNCHTKMHKIGDPKDIEKLKETANRKQ